MGILLGLTAALLWGAGDFLARTAILRIGTYRTLFFMQFIGAIGLGLYLLATGQLQHLLHSTSWQPWAWAILAAILNIISSLLLYRAFAVSSLSIVAPIAASYAALTVFFAFLSGEALTKIHSFALWIVLLGVIAVSTPLINVTGTTNATLVFPWRGDSLQGTLLAVAAAFSYALTFWLLGFHVIPELGGIAPVWLIRSITPCILALCAPAARQSLKIPTGTIWWCIIGVSIFDTVAYIAYTFGMLHAQISVVTMLSSLYSAVTVLLAWLFLHEKLQRSQWFGIAVIFVGIILVNS